MSVFQSPKIHNVAQLEATARTYAGNDGTSPFAIFEIAVTNDEGAAGTIEFYSRSIPQAKLEAIAAAINAAFADDKP